MGDPEIEALHAVWKAEYSDSGVEWSAVLSRLHDSAAPITVVEINSRSAGALNYAEYDKTGLNIIAVGGYSLSRGLTLEGSLHPEIDAERHGTLVGGEAAHDRDFPELLLRVILNGRYDLAGVVLYIKEQQFALSERSHKHELPVSVDVGVSRPGAGSDQGRGRKGRVEDQGAEGKATHRG